MQFAADNKDKVNKYKVDPAQQQSKVNKATSRSSPYLNHDPKLDPIQGPKLDPTMVPNLAPTKVPNLAPTKVTNATAEVSAKATAKAMLLQDLSTAATKCTKAIQLSIDLVALLD